MYPLENYPNLRRTYRHGSKTFYNDRHRGVDLIIPEGKPIRAPFTGHARKDDDDSTDDLGNAVYFQFGDKVMRVAHLSRWGELGSVRQGAIIGYSGNTGKSTGAHAHLDLYDLSKGAFDVNKYENFIDPDQFNWQGESEDEVTREEAIDLIYLATQGHTPRDGERAFALGFSEDRLGELAATRFRDDVVRTAWEASEGTPIPESEKNFWARYQEEHPNAHPSDSIAKTWYHDHVERRIEELRNQIALLTRSSDVSSTEVNQLRKRLSEIESEYEHLRRDGLLIVEERRVVGAQNAALAAKLAETEILLTACKNQTPTTMGPLERIVSGVVELFTGWTKKKE